MVGPGSNGLDWRRVFRVFPVRYTHNAEGYLRGLPGSVMDRKTPRRSGWFCWVDHAVDGWGFTAYRPTQARG